VRNYIIGGCIALALAAIGAGPAMAGGKNPGPAMAVCANAEPEDRSECVKFHLKFQPTHDDERAVAMMRLTLRAGPWACVTQDAYGDKPAYQDCGFGYGWKVGEIHEGQ
jgi:hypothetical protein